MGSRDVSAVDVGQRYFELYHQLHRRVDAAMTAAGMSYSRVKVMLQLDRNGPMNQARLAGLLGFAPRSVTETVDALERDGLVIRTHDQNDRRARIVTLTEAGQEAFATAQLVKRKVMTEIFGSLSPAERREFAAQLDTIRTNLPVGEQS